MQALNDFTHLQFLLLKINILHMWFLHIEILPICNNTFATQKSMLQTAIKKVDFLQVVAPF